MLPESHLGTASLTSGPTTARQPFIDALRGFALFGILVVNMSGFAHPISLRGIEAPRGQTAADAVMATVIQVLGEGKFYALFATLFGLGFALQLGRSTDGSGAFFLRYLRRLGALFVLGILHGVFLWAGDILTLYAVLGIGLLLFSSASMRTVKIWAVVSFCASLLILAVVCLGWRALMMVPEAIQALKSDSSLSAEMQKMADDGYRIYGSGTFGEIVGHRSVEFLSAFFSVLLISGGQIFALLLTGMMIGRSSLFAAPERHAAGFRRALLLGLGVAVPANAALVWGYGRVLEVGFLSEQSPLAYFAAVAGGYFGGPALAVVYASALALLWRRDQGRRFIGLLAPAGRMALTNYLLQSVVCTTLFYSYGFGLFGKVGALGGVALALVLFGLQVVLSHLWLKRYAFGPMEWCWRAITWLRLPPMRKGPPPAEPAIRAG